MLAGSGWLMDRWGTRRGFTLSIIWWSVAGMLHATARGAAGFAVFRFLLGMGEAGSWPASTRAVTEWFPARDRASAIGIFGSGTSVGAMVALPIVSFITLQWGWRAAFLVTGALGFLWLLAWLTDLLATSGTSATLNGGQGDDPPGRGARIPVNARPGALS